MNRKKLIILISIALLIIFGSIGSYFLFRTKTEPEIIPTNSSGSPFGQGGESVSLIDSSSNTPAGTGVDTNGRPVAKLFRLVDAPVSGSVAFIKNGSTVVRYMERATGHIYDINPVTFEKIKITNNTLPKIYEAHFKKDGSGVITRTIKDGSDEVENLSINLIPPKATSTETLHTIQSSILRGFIADLVINNDNSLTYTTKDTGAVISASFLGERPVTLYSSPFTGWKIKAGDGINLNLTTKASVGVSGYSYKVNTKTGRLTKVIGPLNALITNPSPNGMRIAYSHFSDGAAYFKVRKVNSNLISELTPVTLADKCGWSTKQENIIYCAAPSGGIGPTEPDSWYQGITHFSDQIWKFDTEIGFADLLSEPKKDFDVNIDVENPKLAPDEDYLIFTNKNDLTLWALKLN